MKRYSSITAKDVEGLLGSMKTTFDVFEGTTVLVTGAGGFLMSYIVDTLVALSGLGAGKPCRVIALDNFVTGLPERLAHISPSGDFVFLQHDVSKPIDIDLPIDWIVHGASIASPIVYRQFPLETIDANVSGTRHLLDLAHRKGVRGMLIMSTSEIYGDPDPRFIPTPEDYRGNVSCTGPRACYDESKRMAETLGMTYFRLHGTPVKIIRPFNVYGPGLRLDDKRVLPDFVSCVLEGRPIELLSDGLPTRSFCYITDATALMIRTLAAEFKGDAINVGNDEVEISMYDLAGAVSRIGSAELGRDPLEVRRQISPDKDYLTDNPQRRCPDLTRARSLFPDWRPQVGLEEGLSRYIQHNIERRTYT